MTSTSSPAAAPPERLRALFARSFGADVLDRADGGAGPRAVLSSAPGRVELIGNHTDHQGGCTISAAIDRRCWGLAVPNGTRRARLAMEGFGRADVDLDDLAPRARERTTSAALVRGMAALYAREGGRPAGFDMAVCSDVPAGAGVSSSAAFEMMLGLALRELADGPGAPALDRVALACQGSQVEQEYFGKLAGAQDQLASVCGGTSLLDFSRARPEASALPFDERAAGWRIVLVDSGSDHAAHTDDFSQVSSDMAEVARMLGARRLVDVGEREYLARLSEVRGTLGDRRALRALHFFEETARVRRAAEALSAGRHAEFLRLVNASGASSAQFLQNVSPRDAEGASQPAAAVLALCAHLLDGEDADEAVRGRAAWRIHGGGFGGSVLAFVPEPAADAFEARIADLLGRDACLPVRLSPRAACAAALPA